MVTKCLNSSRTKTKEKGKEILMMYIELEKQEQVMVRSFLTDSIVMIFFPEVMFYWVSLYHNNINDMGCLQCWYHVNKT